MKDTIENVGNKAKEVSEGMFNFAQIDTDLEVWFTFEDKAYELAQFNISFGQGVDRKGQPQIETRGGRIMLTLSEAVPDNVYKWAMTSCMRDGKVELRSKTASSPLKVEFKNAYCVNMERLIDVNTGLRTEFIISPEEVIINGINFDNRWVQ